MAEAKKKRTSDADVNPDFPPFFDSVEEMQESGLIDEGVRYSDSGDELACEDAPDDETVIYKNGEDELVELVIPFDHTTEQTHVKFSINLKEFVIPVGVPVTVPKYVRDYWLSLSKQKYEFSKQRHARENQELI